MNTYTNTPSSILIADDEMDVLTALRLLLKGKGYQIASASSAKEILENVNKHTFDVVIMDLNYIRGVTSGAEGLDLIEKLQQVDASLPVVVMTAWASIELAVEAMRRGARDFVPKPWENERLLSIVQTQVALCRALRESKRLRITNQLMGNDLSDTLIAQSSAMKPVLNLIQRAAPSDAHILVHGENGTGKEVITRAIHAASTRAEMPLITVNMGGLSESLFESELFGHVAGAFTDARKDRPGRFELANEGTLFLDEIANLSPRLQAKLLRVLETGEFEPVGSSTTRKANVRIISATNADLWREAAEGRFRQDLLYRLNTITLEIPPLRSRSEDIPLLAEHFLKLYATRYRKNIAGFSTEAINRLQCHSWPGNVRELKHSIERAALMATSEWIQCDDLGLTLQHNGSPDVLCDMNLEEVERLLIQKTLSRYDGNVSDSAKSLGLSRSALYRRIEKYQL